MRPNRLSALGVVLALMVSVLAPTSQPVHADTDIRPIAHEFYMTRGIFSSPTDGDDWGPRWSMDFPEAETHFLVALSRLTRVDAYPYDNAIGLDDLELWNFPFLYLVEVGAMDLTDDERASLRDYLLAGGFMVIDDFWGTWAWDGLRAEMARMFPDRPIVDVPLTHPIFHAMHDITELLQVPNVALAGTDRTHEYDGITPHVRGIFDDDGRLMVLINWNTDLGDAWEWADQANYPLKYSNYAYRLGVNFVLYSMMH